VIEPSIRGRASRASPTWSSSEPDADAVKPAQAGIVLPVTARARQLCEIVRTGPVNRSPDPTTLADTPRVTVTSSEAGGMTGVIVPNDGMLPMMRPLLRSTPTSGAISVPADVVIAKSVSQPFAFVRTSGAINVSRAGFTSAAPPAAPTWMLRVPSAVPMPAGSVGLATPVTVTCDEPLRAPDGKATSAPDASVTMPPEPVTVPCDVVVVAGSNGKVWSSCSAHAAMPTMVAARTS